MRNAAVVCVALLGVLVLTGGARADDRIRYFRDIVIEKGEEVSDAICVGCAVRVKGQAHDVVALWGGVVIDSELSSDVVTLGGGIRLLPGAKVDGDVVAVGGTVVLEPGASVTGEVEAYPYYHFPGQRQVFWRGAAGLAGLNLLVVLLAYLLVRRRRVENMVRTLRARPWATPVVGAVFVVLMFGLYRLPWLSPRLYNTWGSVYAMTTILLAIPYAAGFISVCSLPGSGVRLSGRALETTRHLPA